MRIRTLLPLALLALAAAANATVTYHFTASGGSQDFVLTTPDFVTATQTYADSQFDSNSPLMHTNAATFSPGASQDTLSTNLVLDEGVGLPVDYDVSFTFPAGAFGTAGTYASTNGTGASLVVTQAVPEPASMAALGLGAVALLRRRKRA